MPFKCPVITHRYLDMQNTSGRKERRSAESRIGETYGSLTINSVWFDKVKQRIICSAKCEHSGVEKEYQLSNIVNGGTKSCGCLSTSNRRSAESRIGETKNNMTLLEIVGKNNSGRSIGRFRCEHCGSEHKEARISDWKNNNLKSCGCKKPKKRSKPEDHIGVQYNHLTLIKITGKNKTGGKTGLFRCSNCGKEKDGIRISRVVSGYPKSCGCLNNKAEDAIATVWGNLKLLEVTHQANGKDIKKTKGMFECLLCGNHKEINVAPVKTGIQTDCGCSNYHGYTGHKSFAIYNGMMNRCTNPLAHNYPQYGGRGISVCPRWMEPNGAGLRNFMHDVGDARPSKKHSLHRRWMYNDENKLVEMMVYSPETVMWASARQQTIEQRSPKLKKRVAEFEKLLEKGYSVEEMATELKLSEQKVAFFLSIMGLLDNYKYQEGDDDA